ncbi:protein phosphatase 2C [Ceratocystis lukuohia]|uniref:Protein phosphatase 2C homolog 2 n=2 Tax=Ceratocystis TaxID=5157 RepID=A0A2C5X8Q1_9PEZI|nr:Protein phosphatase 2C -like protein 2 [Ceratocystis fimbriata CBS 114723]
MGQTLSEPVVEKTSEKGEDSKLLYGVSAMQGWRISMEDAHINVLDLLAATKQTSTVEGQMSLFGVFDGHGGDRVAQFSGKHIHEILVKQDSFKEGNFKKALEDCFLATDRAILNNPRYEDEVSGCTACVALVVGDKLYVANAGDSRSVLGIKGRAKPMSNDHKPTLESEKARITAAGGFVDFGRVNGNLALSRAIGDFEFKKSADLPPEQQIVTVFPEVETHQLTEDDEFLVVACDGIWDCQSSQAVVEFVRRGIAAKQDLDKICENMMDNCVASSSETGGVGCDNMTMSIIAFLNGKTKEEWYEQVAQRVADGDGPCAPPAYAEFRGPGFHHGYDEVEETYEEDKFKAHRIGLGNYPGRIIFLGDGNESNMSLENEDAEMFDSIEEEKDLQSQIPKDNSPKAAADSSADSSAGNGDATATAAADKSQTKPQSITAAAVNGEEKK